MDPVICGCRLRDFRWIPSPKESGRLDVLACGKAGSGCSSFRGIFPVPSLRAVPASRHPLPKWHLRKCAWTGCFFVGCRGRESTIYVSISTYLTCAEYLPEKATGDKADFFLGKPCRTALGKRCIFTRIF